MKVFLENIYKYRGKNVKIFFSSNFIILQKIGKNLGRSPHISTFDYSFIKKKVFSILSKAFYHPEFFKNWNPVVLSLLEEPLLQHLWFILMLKRFHTSSYLYLSLKFVPAPLSRKHFPPRSCFFFILIIWLLSM